MSWSNNHSISDRYTLLQDKEGEGIGKTISSPLQTKNSEAKTEEKGKEGDLEMHPLLGTSCDTGLYGEKQQEQPQHRKLVRPFINTAIAVYCLMAFFSPQVFRFILRARFGQQESISTSAPLFDPGNATISVSTDPLSTAACTDFRGVTLASIDLTATDVRAPGWNYGASVSWALFASYDGKKWINMYSPSHFEESFIKSFKEDFKTITNETGLACLASDSLHYVYIVACLNVDNLASKFKKGEEVPGYPFNRQCFQVAGICTIPGQLLDNGQRLPGCSVDGILDQDRMVSQNLTSDSTTTNDDEDNSTTSTYTDVLIDALIFAFFITTFFSFLDYSPILSGSPSELPEEPIQCNGFVALGLGSPFSSEHVVLLFRSMIGRACTQCEPILTDKHKIDCLITDFFLNERPELMQSREKAWGAFLTFFQEVIELVNNKKLPTGTSRTEGGKTFPVHEVDVSQLKAAMPFFEKWLALLQENEKHFKYPLDAKDRSVEVIGKIVALAPLDTLFKEDKDTVKADQLRNSLRKLKETTEAAVTDLFPFRKQYYYPDYVNKIIWNIVDSKKERKSQLQWVFMARAKLELKPDATLPEPYLTDSTKVQIGAIVYLKPVVAFPQEGQTFADDWLQSRKDIYKVIDINEETKKATIQPFPLPIQTVQNHGNTMDDIEGQRLALPATVPGSVPPTSTTERTNTFSWLSIWTSCKNKLFGSSDTSAALFIDASQQQLVSLTSLELLDAHHGKPGGLNACIAYYRRCVSEWKRDKFIAHRSDENFLLAPNIRTVFAILDARHTIIQPKVFWICSLPYFARDRLSGQSLIELGKGLVTLCVQFPQFFVNVIDDFVDNNNWLYYNLNMPLRDCAKCITSCGTNGLWDITDPLFQFATTSQIEDTATSQKYLEKYAFVYLLHFVSHGIAKEHKDYVEATFRWTTGAVQELWNSLLNKWHCYFVMLVLGGLFALACFHPSNMAYWLAWVIPLCLIGSYAYYEKNQGLRPFRSLVSSAIIVSNTTYWISNILSIIWMFIIPTAVGIFGVMPLSNNQMESFTWILILFLLRLPPAIIQDCIVFMILKLSKEKEFHSERFNANTAILRSSQSYSVSFLATALAVLRGTTTSFAASRYHKDNTSWNSFNTKQWYQDPYFLTCLNALFIYSWNIICFIVSISYVNYNNPVNLINSITVCGLNIFLTHDITTELVIKPIEISLRKWSGIRITLAPMKFTYFFLLLSLCGLILLSVRETVPIGWSDIYSLFAPNGSISQF